MCVYVYFVCVCVCVCLGAYLNVCDREITFLGYVSVDVLQFSFSHRFVHIFSFLDERGRSTYVWIMIMKITN